MRSMFLRTTISSFLLAAAFAAPAAAQTGFTTPLNPCYVVAQPDQRELITVTAAGFTPFSNVDVLLDDIRQVQVQVMLDGTIDGKLEAPYLESGTRPFTLRLSEVGKLENTLVARSLVTRLSVQQSPPSASTGQRVRFKGRGFTDFTKPVYAHYLFAGKARQSVRLGLPQTPCGTFNVRRKQFPFKNPPKVGVWTIQFDQNPHYDPKAAVRVPMKIRVQRTTVKPQRAQAR